MTSDMLTKSCSSLINFSVITIHPSVTDPVESLFPPGFRKNRHWVGQFPTGSVNYFWLEFLIGLFDSKNGQLSKIRGFLLFFHYPVPRKWLFYNTFIVAKLKELS